MDRAGAHITNELSWSENLIPVCQPSHTPELNPIERVWEYQIDFLDIKRRHTQRYEQNIYGRVKQSSMEQIGREEGLSYDEIKGIFERANKTKKKRIGNRLNEFVSTR